MKATRLFLAALAVALASACTSADITGPSVTDSQLNQSETPAPPAATATRGGTLGSGN